MKLKKFTMQIIPDDHGSVVSVEIRKRHWVVLWVLVICAMYFPIDFVYSNWIKSSEHKHQRVTRSAQGITIPKQEYDSIIALQTRLKNILSITGKDSLVTPNP